MPGGPAIRVDSICAGHVSDRVQGMRCRATKRHPGKAGPSTQTDPRPCTGTDPTPTDCPLDTMNPTAALQGEALYALLEQARDLLHDYGEDRHTTIHPQ